ncbi:MAG TPA: hypothetical protein VM012_02570 [Flavitalea sp.]|nr:hypothetical protein [Flavitalea sp.]
MTKVIFIGLILVMVAGYLQAQLLSRENLPRPSTSQHRVAEGPGVYGVFEGRFPCQELARQWNHTVSQDCYKSKWRLTLYQDSLTKKPSRYVLEGSFYRDKPREGNWSIVPGSKIYYAAQIFKLDEAIFFLKGDENVLFVLDNQKNLLIGNEDFSYTLSRVDN